MEKLTLAPNLSTYVNISHTHLKINDQVCLITNSTIGLSYRDKYLIDDALKHNQKVNLTIIVCTVFFLFRNKKRARLTKRLFSSINGKY